MARPCDTASKPPSGANWVHEIKHDGYRLLVRRVGALVQLFTRTGFNWTSRFPAIAPAAQQTRARSFMIDGEAVVLGPDGLSRFDELRRRERAYRVSHYAFDLIEQDGEDLRRRPFLSWMARMRGSSSTSTSPRMALRSSCTPAASEPRASSRSGWMAPTDPVGARFGSRSAIPTVPPYRESAARSGIDRADIRNALPLAVLIPHRHASLYCARNAGPPTASIGERAAHKSQ